MINEMRASRGEIKLNSKLRIGVYNQHFIDVLPYDSTPIQYLLSLYDDVENYQSSFIIFISSLIKRKSSKIYHLFFLKIVRNILGKFGLDGTAHELQMKFLFFFAFFFFFINFSLNFSLNYHHSFSPFFYFFWFDF